MTAPQNLERLLYRLRSQSALYIVGAGASAPVVPFGRPALTLPARDLVRSGVIRPQPADKTALTDWIRREAHSIDFFPEFPAPRPGMLQYPVEAALSRLTESAVLASLMHHLSTPRYLQVRIANYTIFRAFVASLILNYNVDGLAADACGLHHHLVDMHGSIEAGYGGPAGHALVRLTHEYGEEICRPDLVLLAPELPTNERLWRKLHLIAHSSPAFVMIVGYTFGRTESGYHDQLSLEMFAKRFHRSNVDVYILDPQSSDLAGMLQERLSSNRVYPFPVYWNILAWAFTLSVLGKLSATRLHYFHDHVLDAHGPGVVFPRAASLA